MVTGGLREMIEAFNTEMRFLVGQSEQSTILLMLNEGFYAIADRRLNTSLKWRGVKFVNFVLVHPVPYRAIRLVLPIKGDADLAKLRAAAENAPAFNYSNWPDLERRGIRIFRLHDLGAEAVGRADFTRDL